MTALLAALALVVGLVLGLTGAGGGMLAVPVLMFCLDWTVAQAAPVALLAVAGAAWVGTFDGLRRGLARYRAALLMAVAALPGTGLGLTLARLLPERALTTLFVLIMVLAALRLLRAGEALLENEEALCRVHADSGRFVWTPLTFLAMAGFGAGSGLLTGLLGVGGGFVIVPVLRRYTALSLPAVVATSLMVVALVSSAGLFLAWREGPVIPDVAWFFLALVVAGMLPGRWLSRRVSARVSQYGFAWLMLAVAAMLLVRAWWPHFGV